MNVDLGQMRAVECDYLVLWWPGAANWCDVQFGGVSDVARRVGQPAAVASLREAPKLPFARRDLVDRSTVRRDREQMQVPADLGIEVDRLAVRRQIGRAHV